MSENREQRIIQISPLAASFIGFPTLAAAVTLIWNSSVVYNTTMESKRRLDNIETLDLAAVVASSHDHFLSIDAKLNGHDEKLNTILSQIQGLEDKVDFALDSNSPRAQRPRK